MQPQNELELVRALERIEAKLDNHLSNYNEQAPKLQEVLDMLQKSKGAFALFRFVMFILSPVIAAAIWIKNHVNF